VCYLNKLQNAQCNDKHHPRYLDLCNDYKLRYSTTPLWCEGKGKTIPVQACYRSWRVPGGWDPKTSRQSAHEVGIVVSPTHRPPLPPRKYSSILISASSWVDPRATVRPEGWHHRPSNPRPSVAQCLNQLRHRVPPSLWCAD